MCPFELTATPATSPRCMSGGSFKRLGTESYGISGGDCCANAEVLKSAASPTSHLFMIDLPDPGGVAVIVPAVGPSIQMAGRATQSDTGRLRKRRRGHALH